MGLYHEYCPPEQVETEIENLLNWLKGFESKNTIIVAAWFHHRFTQIHPYQDGNGRVVRALTTLILLRANLLPLVIDRDLRGEYISSLEAADSGDLMPLASMFARLERSAMLQAMSVDIDAETSQPMKLSSAVIQSLSQKLQRRKLRKDAELREVDKLTVALRGKVNQVLGDILKELSKSVSEDPSPNVYVKDGGPDQYPDNSYWYRREVIKSANEASKFANFDEAHYFVKATIRVGRERLTLVTSFHHVGREIYGISEAVAFAKIESFENSDDREVMEEDFFVCSLDPFVYTYQTLETEAAASFEAWLDSAVVIALKKFGDRL